MAKDELVQKEIESKAHDMAFGMLLDAMEEIAPGDKIHVIRFVREHRNVSNRLRKVLEQFTGPETDTSEEAFKSAAAFLSKTYPSCSISIWSNSKNRR